MTDLPIVDSGHEEVGNVVWGYELRGSDVRGWRWAARCMFESASGVAATREEARKSATEFAGAMPPC